MISANLATHGSGCSRPAYANTCSSYLIYLFVCHNSTLHCWLTTVTWDLLVTWRLGLQTCTSNSLPPLLRMFESQLWTSRDRQSAVKATLGTIKWHFDLLSVWDEKCQLKNWLFYTDFRPTCLCSARLNKFCHVFLKVEDSVFDEKYIFGCHI